MSTESPTINQSTAEKKFINLRALAHQMDRLAAVEQQITGNPPDQDYLKYAKITAAGIFRIVVMGEIKKGKSSFINALLGTDGLVPVHEDVATSTVFKIHYGPDVKYTVYFEKETGKEKLVIQLGELNEYGTEAGNPDNEKRVKYIRVESPVALLKNGLVIVDTPGVGGLFKKHREITWRHAPDADAVFFITESNRAPIGEEEVTFLKDLRQITPNITFVQTKSSKVEPDARNARMGNNLKILREELQIVEKDLTYFVVDSKLKVLADARKHAKLLDQSGFPPLMTYLNITLRKKQELTVAQAAIRRSVSRLLPLAKTLDNRKKLLDADTVTKREAIARENESAKNLLLDWERESKPRILQQFSKGMTALSQRAIEELSPLQPLGSIFCEFSRELRNATSKDHLRQLLTQVQNDLATLASKACLKICETTKEDATFLIESLTKDIAVSMLKSYELKLGSEKAENIYVNTDMLQILIGKDTDAFDIKSLARSGLTGSAIVTTIGGILGSVIPGVGTAVGVFMGAVAVAWWVKSDLEDKDDKELDSLKQQACGALQLALSTAYQSSTRHVNRLISDLQSEATEVLQLIIKSVHQEFEAKQAELNKRQKATSEEVRQDQQNLAKCKSELESVQKSLTAFHSALPA
jgi:hypothetical protein